MAHSLRTALGLSETGAPFLDSSIHVLTMKRQLGTVTNKRNPTGCLQLRHAAGFASFYPRCVPRSKRVEEGTSPLVHVTTARPSGPPHHTVLCTMPRFSSKAEVLAYEAPRGLIVGGAGCCLVYLDPTRGEEEECRRLVGDGECCVCVATSGDLTVAGTAEGVVAGCQGGGVEGVDCLRERLGDVSICAVLPTHDAMGLPTVIAADVSGTIARYAPWQDGALWKRQLARHMAALAPIHFADPADQSAAAAAAAGGVPADTVSTHLAESRRYVVAVTAYCTAERPAADAGGALHVLTWTGRHVGSYRLPVHMTPSCAAGVAEGLVLGTYRDPHALYLLTITAPAADGGTAAAPAVAARKVMLWSTPILRILPLRRSADDRGMHKLVISSGTQVAAVRFHATNEALTPVVTPLFTPATYIDDICLCGGDGVAAVDASGAITQVTVE